jgi:hypothetical protein
VTRTAPHPEEYSQWLVVSPKEGKDEYVKGKAWQVYEAFDSVKKDKALICIGSVKSNPVIEIVLAKAFGAEPFASQDHVIKARDRRCPLWFRFREGVDPELPSCAGGRQLSRRDAADAPGIYYETRDGSWACVPWTTDGHDAALVFYQYFPALGRLELIAGGFSSRATRFLSQVIAPNLASKFWPPVYETTSLHMGAYLVRFEFAGREPPERDILSSRFDGNHEVIALERQVFARRIR